MALLRNRITTEIPTAVEKAMKSAGAKIDAAASKGSSKLEIQYTTADGETMTTTLSRKGLPSGDVLKRQLSLI